MLPTVLVALELHGGHLIVRDLTGLFCGCDADVPTVLALQVIRGVGVIRTQLLLGYPRVVFLSLIIHILLQVWL